MTEVADFNPEVQEQLRDPRAESLAILLARDYAEKNYPKVGEDENGEPVFEPAWRGANGEKAFRGKSPEDVAADLVADGWTTEAAAAEAATKVVDIANTPYDQFPEYWKEANRGGAEFLIGLLDERGANTLAGLDLSDLAVRSEYGGLIHDNWLANNEWAKGGELGVSFDRLSAEEQQKDIDQLGVLQTWLAEQPRDFSAERELSDAMIRTAEEVLGDLRREGLTFTYKPHAYWEGPRFEETATVDLSEDVLEKLKSLGYPDAKQAYMVKTGSYSDGSWRGFDGAYVRGKQINYELRILTGNELGKYDKHPNPDAFLGRDFAILSPECPVRLNTRLNTEAQAKDNRSEMAIGSTSHQVLEQILIELHSAQSTETEPKFVARNRLR